MHRSFKPRALVGNFRSKSEERFAGHLNDLGVTYEYEPKDKKLSYAIERTAYYQPDFVVDGWPFIIEVKGYFPSSDRAKYLRVRASNPKTDIRFVFDRASTKLSKTSKTTYADWCDKHGFKWCEKIIPPNWIKKAQNERASSKAAGKENSSSPRKGLKHQSARGTHGSRSLPLGRKYLRAS